MKEIIASKTRAELVEKLRNLQQDIRAWLQANGEVSFLTGIAIGCVFILFFKAILLLLALLVILFGIWWIWLEQKTV